MTHFIVLCCKHAFGLNIVRGQMNPGTMAETVSYTFFGTKHPGCLGTVPTFKFLVFRYDSQPAAHLFL